MNRLDAIFETKRAEVAEARAQTPLSELRSLAADQAPTRGFRRSLEGHQDLGLIAEVKQSSPSRGIIRADLDAAQVASAYERAGAHCLSVLTDRRYFGGSRENLEVARKTTKLPVLRKDFLFDPYQVWEARAWGADAVLLIVAGLERSSIQDLQALARELGMDALVEVHTCDEAEVALESGADLVGVNNRNLATFETSLDTSLEILPMLRGRALAVSESALESRRDLDRVKAAGAEAVLIGTTFCAAPDIEAKVQEVMGW
ncbi:MAG TPA: indole-3-glycerol phosphate synthase TrpC [Fimbriimonadaceae bacterium]|nr:indole-3-glycerol phosphate synthase TrpC [Fimbriimonadaceae bacterium]